MEDSASYFKAVRELFYSDSLHRICERSGHPKSNLQINRMLPYLLPVMNIKLITGKERKIQLEEHVIVSKAAGHANQILIMHCYHDTH